MEHLLAISLIVGVLSVDSFSAAFAYGSGGIKIPLKSLFILNLIGVALFGASLYFGYFLRPLLPGNTVYVLSSIILVTLGSLKIFESAIKNFIKRRQRSETDLVFSIFNASFILKVYADPEEADLDQSRSISSREATFLAVALSLDNMAVGFGAGMVMNPGLVLLTYLVINFVCLFLGCQIGNRVARTIKQDLAWLGGVILILVAFI